MIRRFKTSDGIELAVGETGPSRAEKTIVLLHGWTEDHTVWDRVIPLLGDGVRVVAPDHRGHGDSELAPKGSANLERLADDVTELLAKRVPTGRLVLAGHSMGGMTLMALAARHPELIAERVDGAAFIATSPVHMQDVMSRVPAPLAVAADVQRRVRKLRRKVLGKPAKPSTPRRGALPGGDERAARIVTRMVAFGDNPDAAAVQETVDQAKRIYPGNASEFYRSMCRHDGADALAAYKSVPTAVLVGEHDTLTPPSHARMIAAQLPSTEFVFFPGAGHMLPYERTDEVAGAIRSVAGN